MKHLYFVFISLFLVFSILSCGTDDSKKAENEDTGILYEGRYREVVFPSVGITKDIEYGAATTWDGEEEILILDLYQPDGDLEKQRAAIVWIHGGGFVSGDKSNSAMSYLSEEFSKRGYVCASINYRIVTEEQFAKSPVPEIIDAMHDARAAVRWLHANASHYRIDTERIAIGGGSAGAYTALNVAYLEDEGTSGNPGYPSEVKAVVDFWGGMINYSEMETGEAPLIIIHGTADKTVPFTNAESLVQRAIETGIPYEFHPLEGAPHAAWNNMDQYIEWIVPFLYEYVIR
jgi:para-nitrobenzyl esterase